MLKNEQEEGAAAAAHSDVEVESISRKYGFGVVFIKIIAMKLLCDAQLQKLSCIP